MSNDSDRSDNDMELDKELTPKETNDDVHNAVARARTYTEKGREYQATIKRQRCVSTQNQLSKLMGKLHNLLEDVDNVHVVQNNLEQFTKLLIEFQETYSIWRALLTEPNKGADDEWYNEHWQCFTDFKVTIRQWIIVAKRKIEEQLEEQLEAKLNVSQSSHSVKSKSSHGSHSSRQSNASLISAMAIERAKVAELKAKANMLEKKQALENEFEKLKLQEQILVAEARENAFAQMDNEFNPDVSRNKEGMNEYLESSNLAKKIPTFIKSETIERSRETDRDKLLIDIKDNVDESKPAEFKPTPYGTNPSNIPTVLNNPFPRRPTIQIPRFSPLHSSFTFESPPSRRDRLKTPHPSEPINPRSDPLIRILEKQNKLTETLHHQHQQSLLPPLSLTAFKGEPTEYHVFIRTFETRIESRLTTSETRLQYLEQHLQGEPKELIQGCLHMEPKRGYAESRRLLDEKYGDPYKVSNAYLKKVADWPSIRPGDEAALDKFATFLTQCVNAMESLSYLVILDHPQNLQSLVKKLPFFLQERWRREVIKIRDTKKNPVFSHFVKFIKAEAKVATDPVFSRQALERVGHDDKGRSKVRWPTSKIVSGVTISDSTHSKLCILCNKMHDLDDCKEYMKRSLSDRKTLISEKGLCYACYGKGHRSRGCITRRTCKICSGRHPTGLHDENFRPKNSPTETLKKTGNTNSSTQTDGKNDLNSACSVASGEASCLTCHVAAMPIVPVRLTCGEKEIITYAMLDSCSTGTFISEEAFEQLEADGIDTKVRIRTMNGPRIHDSKIVTGLVVSHMNGENPVELPKTFVRDEIPGTETEIPHPESFRRWPHLERVVKKVPPYMTNVKIGLLIGTNCPKAIEPKDFVASQNGGPFAVLTFAGWTVVGPLYMSNNITDVDCHRIIVQEIGAERPSEHHFMVERSVKEIVTPEALNKMFELEFNERNDDGNRHSQDDKRFLEKIQSGVNYVDGHHVMPLPFRDDDVFMPSNKAQAILRANWLKKKLIKNKDFHEDYRKFMQNTLEKGYARKIPHQSIPTSEGKVWYLPHHGIYHAKKPTKIRVVFDCSAKFKGTSLNDKLLQGPDLTNSLVGVLTRFREEQNAFMGDIEGMFHQVRVNEEHRDFLRFLWWPDGDLTKELEEYQMNVHLFGAISSPSCSNYALRKTADDFEREEGTQAANVLRKNFYVDDCLRSEPTERGAIERIDRVTRICARGGFRLTKFISNRRTVLESIPEEERSKEVKTLDLSGRDHLPIERALGVQWTVESDELGFKIILSDKPLTRRGILSTISSIYDPIGMAAPVLLPGKKILQDLCKEKLDWDDDLPDEYRSRWEKWRIELAALEQFSMAQCLKPENFGTVKTQEIHSFSDASLIGYGQVSYLRQINDRGEIFCAFLMGKARLTPLKSITIPRLELTAALLSAKIGSMMKKELDVQDDVYWTDSTTVIRYINNEQARFQTFVANRVQSIRDITDVSQWNYVDSKDNPADDASRGMKIHTFLINNVGLEDQSSCV